MVPRVVYGSTSRKEKVPQHSVKFTANKNLGNNEKANQHRVSGGPQVHIQLASLEFIPHDPPSEVLSRFATRN